MPPLPEPVTAATAGRRLGKSPITIRQWARRYNARQLDGKLGRGKAYDYVDLATIDGCIHRGEEVPATPEARDELRARLRESFRTAA